MSTILGQNSKFHSILERYIPQMGRQILCPEKAFEEDDLSSVAALAHWRKGSGANAGYKGFTTLGEDLENSSRMSNRDSVRLRIEAIKHDADRSAAGGAIRS